MKEETKRERRASILEHGKKSFAEHTLELRSGEKDKVRMWCVSKPGTWMYGFYVIAAPGMLLVYGDVGDHMLRINDADPIPWLQRAAGSTDYVLSKIIKPQKCLVTGEARHFIFEIERGDPDNGVEPDPETAQAIRADWQHEDSGDDFARAVYEHDTGDLLEGAACCSDYNSDALWTVACLRRFIELFENGEAGKPALLRVVSDPQETAKEGKENE